MAVVTEADGKFYCRVDESQVIVEIVKVPQGGDIEKMFHPDLHFVPLPDGAEGGDILLDGKSLHKRPQDYPAVFDYTKSEWVIDPEVKHEIDIDIRSQEIQDELIEFLPELVSDLNRMSQGVLPTDLFRNIEDRLPKTFKARRDGFKIRRRR